MQKITAFLPRRSGFIVDDRSRDDSKSLPRKKVVPKHLDRYFESGVLMDL